MNESLCEFCLQPKESKRSGSITQWVSLCRCEHKNEEEQYQSLKICTSCHKKINLARHGTFTQWIFRTEFCKCFQPQIEQPAGSHTDSSKPESKPIDYPECEVDSDFPYNRFSPIEILGKGKNGIVYRSQDKLLMKIVAVKVLQNLAPEQVIAFQKEAKITSLLNHPNIIAVIDISATEKGTPYIVLEYVTGTSLRHYLGETNNGIGESTALRISTQLASALAHAHEKKIFHRDLKPENILITRNDREEIEAKIIDFGLAATLKESLEFEGKTLVGTPPYMSPDQAAGLPFDARSDLYSLGCILFECLTGKPPFENDTALEVLHRQLSEESPQLDLNNNPENDRLRAVVSRLLKRDPKQRYQSAEALLKDLANILEPAVETGEVEDGTQANESKSYRNLTFFFISSLSLLALGYFIFAGQSKNTNEQKTPEKLSDEVHDSMFPSHKRFDHFDESKEPGLAKANEVVDDNSLKRLQNRKDLNTLDLSNTMIDGSGLKYLTNIPLRALMLDKCDITDEDIVPLYDIKTLKFLSLSRTKVEGIGFDKFQTLDALSVYDSKVGDEGMLYISKIKPLSHLHMSGWLITGKGINYLAQNSEIKIITIEGAGDLTSILPAIKNIKSLRRLRFVTRHLIKSDLEPVRNFAIEEMHIWTCTNSPGCIEELAKCKKLKKLILSDGYLSAGELQSLKKSLPNCAIEVLSTQSMKDRKVIRSLVELEKDEKEVSDFLAD